MSDGTSGVPAAMMGATGMLSAVSGLILYKGKMQRAYIELITSFGAMLLLCITMSSAVVFSDNLAFRLRSAGPNSFIWKVLPGVFGLPVAPAGMFIVLSIVADVLTLELCRVFHSDPSSLRIHFSSLAYAIGGYGLSCLSASRLCNIFEVQEALASEKALLEKIITMMCDAMIWLSEDGSTIVRTDNRLSMLAARDVTGEDIHDLFDPDEQERFREAAELARTAPVLLPTTLKTMTGPGLPIEMFIVGNRNASSAEGKVKKAPGFLIGVRAGDVKGNAQGPNNDAAELQEGLDASQEHNTDMDILGSMASLELDTAEDAQSAHSSMPSVPRSTVTGRIFDSVDVDRHLEGTPEERMAEVKESLARVVTLGQNERWLIRAQDVLLDTTQVLGAGGFGCVHGGLLYGSPIAVKSIRYSADSGGMKQLVAIVNEVRILRHARHPSIVVFSGACMDSTLGVVLLLLERINGPPLHEYVAAHSADCEIHNRFKLLLDIACALRYLHAQVPQIIHGDLKDSNVMVEPAMPRAKLVDFGLSRLRTCHARPLGGTLAWMAPEIIFRRDRNPKPSADVFSFGRVAYLLITSSRPFAGVSRRAIKEMARIGAVHAHVWREDKPLQKECRRMCDQVLSIVPEHRPDMARIHTELLSWVLPDAGEANKPSDEPSGPRAEDVAGHRGETVLSRIVDPLRKVLSLAPAGQQQQQRAAGPEPISEAALALGNKEPVLQPGDLVLPDRRPTKESTMQLMVLETAMQWNFSCPSPCCCAAHAAMSQVQRVAQDLMQGDCKPWYQPHRAFQCDGCGTLDAQFNPVCEVCGRQHREQGMPTVQEQSEEEQEEGGQSTTGEAGTSCSL